METMYDRLGDLLNETLEAGHVKFVKPKPMEKPQEKEIPREEPKVEMPKDGTKHSWNENRREKNVPPKSGKFHDSGQKSTGTIIKYVSPDLERALRLLGVTSSASKEEVKKAYKEKLQYYHPDKHAGNPILEKVAGDKTRQVVEAYEMICKYLEK